MLADYPLSLPFRFLKGIFNFVVFWYVKSSKEFWRQEIAFVRKVESDIGILVNLKLITQPIFGDYSAMGKIIGPIFRLCRVFIGSAIVIISLMVIIVSYVVWLIMPALVIVMVLRNLWYILVQ